MFRTRLLLIGCALASVAACADHVVGPVGSPNAVGNPPAGPVGPTLEAIQGVLEQIDDRFGLRQPDRLVMVRYDDTNALMSVLGKEVILRGTFTADGEFSVTSLQLVEDLGGGDATFRVPAAKPVSTKTGVKR